MTTRELTRFAAKLIVLVGVIIVMYLNNYKVTTGGTVGLGSIILIGYFLSKKYKDVKDFCLETMMRLRVKDNMRIKTYRRELFAWIFYWLHLVLPIGLLYYFVSYMEASNQSMSETLIQVMGVVAVGAFIAFISIFVDNTN